MKMLGCLPMLPRDPLWRRALIRLGSFMMSWSYDLHSDAEEPTLVDRLAWKMEDFGTVLFHAGYYDSYEEAADALHLGEECAPTVFLSPLACEIRERWNELLDQEVV